ncbi:MAG: penicillin-binding protein 2 [Clostridia bacterium]|nr:penicillin-binding protein 2 [Clostridia bacterium]
MYKGKRLIVLGILLTVVFISLLGKIAVIQIFKNKELSNKSVLQHIIKIDISGNEVEGGRILDRNFIPITNAKVVKKLIVIKDILDDPAKAEIIINKLTDNKIHMKDDNYSVEVYHITKTDLVLEKLIRENAYNGILIADVYPRYDDHSVARHVVGYVRDNNPKIRAGIEDKYYKYLHSSNYKKYLTMIKDGKQNVIPQFGYSIIGDSYNKINKSVQLTLDYYIQAEIEKIVDGGYSDNEKIESGAVVVMDVNTGEILAMVSRPNFDQNEIGAATSGQLWNKAIQTYPPGSIFKIIVAAAAIEDDKLDFSNKFLCDGDIDVHGINYSCHHVHGMIDIKEAFARSCNCAFIQLGNEVGGQKIKEMAEKFGLGKQTDIELPGESPGLLPSAKEYINAGIGNFSIGQGKVEVSPVQMAKMISIIARGGTDIEPRIVKSIITSDEEIIDLIKRDNMNKRIISADTAQMLKILLREVTLNGSGNSADSDLVGGTAGKTGTPQFNQEQYAAWFIGYFPVVQPQYAVVVFDRSKGGGGKVAAPIFKRIAEKIYLIKN